MTTTKKLLFLLQKNVFFCVLYALTFSSCGIHQYQRCDFSVRKANIPVFIEIPQNKLVFNNITPLLYDVFIAHFERIGYKIVSSSLDGYTLKINIKSLDPTYKYISPDVLLYHATIKIELLCQLYNYKNNIVAQKNFTVTTLISKPQNPIMSSDVNEFTYTRLIEKTAPKVEQFFRKFLLKSVEE